METLSVDIETYSETDIVKCGSFRYVDDPKFEIMLLGFGYNNEPVEVIDLTHGDLVPKDVLRDLYDPRVIKTGWNNAFERYAFWKHFGQYCPPEQWEDSMVLAAQCGLPASLDAAGKALGLGEDAAKMKEGKALIRYFCVPCKPTNANGGRTRNLPEHNPEKWLTFKQYNGQDVVAERTIRNMLLKWKPDEVEHRFWCLDARINEKGVRIDKSLAANAVAMDSAYKEELTAKAVALTGLENPKSVGQIKSWLFDQEGKEFPSLNKKVIADVVSQLRTDRAKEFMSIRGELSKSSTAKYEAMLRSVCPDGHGKGYFQFYGANRTGRFAGRLVQLQNLPQNHLPDLAQARALVSAGKYEAMKALYDGVSKPLSELIRTALIPEEGHQFLVADFSAIEARVIAWFADEQWRLEVFKSGGDIYCASASQMFKVPVEKHGRNSHLRQKGKVAELALGYGGGVNALKAFGADKMGMTEEEMQETVDLWRGSSPRICALWRSLEKAAIRCVVRRGTTTSDMASIRFDYEDGILWMCLPSGRRIAYYGAKYEPSQRNRERKVLSYMGVDQSTKKWSRVETWGGKLTENCWAGGTPVLTDRGWICIREVREDDLLWDGSSWVHHCGVAERGVRPTICLDGLHVTADHKILTTEGWVNAEACNGLDRARVQLPEGPWEKQREGFPREGEVDRAMRLRKRTRNRHSRPSQEGKSRTSCVMWMQEKPVHRRAQHPARNEQSPGLRSVALDDTKMYKANTPSLEKLRRAWDHGLRKVAKQFRGILGGHGALVSARFGAGSGEQRFRVLPWELPLGVEDNELSEQAWGQDGRGIRPEVADEGGVRADRHQLHHSSLSTGQRLSTGASAGQGRREEPVYDILNAGSKHQYVVLGNTGPIIAHNCVQATARDCLRESMLALDAAGYDIRAHVHDEVIVTEPLDGRSVEEMAELMGKPIPWAPGLPLRADGYATPFYRKD